VSWPGFCLAIRILLDSIFLHPRPRKTVSLKQRKLEWKKGHFVIYSALSLGAKCTRLCKPVCIGGSFGRFPQTGHHQHGYCVKMELKFEFKVWGGYCIRIRSVAMGVRHPVQSSSVCSATSDHLAKSHWIASPSLPQNHRYTRMPRTRKWHLLHISLVVAVLGAALGTAYAHAAQDCRSSCAPGFYHTGSQCLECPAGSLYVVKRKRTEL